MSTKKQHGGKRQGAGRKFVDPEQRRSHKYWFRLPESVYVAVGKQRQPGERDSELLRRMIKAGSGYLTATQAQDSVLVNETKLICLRTSQGLAGLIESQRRPGESSYRLLRRLVEAGCRSIAEQRKA